MKNVAGEALRVNPQQRNSGVNITHHKSDRFFDLVASLGAGFGAKPIDPELAPAGGKIRGGHWLNSFEVHALIIAAARLDDSEGACSLATCPKVKDGVLFGGDGDSILRCGMEMPILQCSQNFLVELGAHTFENSFADDFPTLVDGDLDHHSSLRRRQFPGISNRIGSSDRQSRTNFIAIHWPPGQSAVRKSRSCSVTQT